ncbi:response regulator transcription factor [Sediminibacterium ginsengisoli]|uniref:DNA-binding response regulator, NarL/FixJ family, contains REC and HTH domains n=1 Tax=Sediminibacterium ginsengisoli TaxID=413434 RepID=A0A1T4R4N7_9BACT|nr:response regulator transcription factor [Sediminibacterium ginsengisoli]SKA11034.1 DNA-binding response regulator, NarL/FixJ family, contains REC and HTH domains [Sediminibacterium ginsengisoli]
MRYKVAITDDKPNIIASVSQELVHSGKIDIVFTARNGADFLEKLNKLPADQHPQVVLMDIDMPVMNGIEAVRQGSSLYPAIQYVMLTVFDDDDKLFEALQAGAGGYLLKDNRHEEILEAIEEIIEKKGAPMSPRIARKTLKLLLNQSPVHKTDTVKTGLSEREEEILRNMVAGMDYRQIAAKLFISPHTVRNHITRIYDKLHITSKTQAVKLAIKNKWV